jgi:hypothetical protein
MRREPLIDVPPWALPVVVLAVTMPIVIAMITAGPFLGLVIGGLVAAAVVLTAVRLATVPPCRWRRRPTRDSPRRPDGAR